MKNKKRTVRILAAAAMISLLSVTAYAAEVLHIRSLESGRSEHFETYSDMDRAIAKAGLQTTIPDKFENGFRFQGGEVQEVEAKDDSGNSFRNPVMPSLKAFFPSAKPGLCWV